MLTLKCAGLTVNPDRASIKIVSTPPYPQLGDTVDLRCEVTGAGRGYQVNWTKVGQPGTLGDNVMARGNVVRFTSVERSNNGLYRCSVRTRHGTPYADYSLAVSGSPR